MGTIKTNGYPSIEEIREANGWPSEKRFAKGPVAICECVQEIPCNPCETACPRKAINIGEPITKTPVVDLDECIGCGLCIACCPGLAIFVVDKTYSNTEATISFPYEYLPLPKNGSNVKAVDRKGNQVCGGRVTNVMASKSMDHTAVVTIAVPKEFSDDVRSMARLDAADHSADFRPVSAEELYELDGFLDDDIIVCRCEEVTAGDIRKAIREYESDSITGIKRRVRAGMGLCQGRTCGKLVSRIIQDELCKSASEINDATKRPPVRPVTFRELAAEADSEWNDNSPKGGFHE